MKEQHMAQVTYETWRAFERVNGRYGHPRWHNLLKSKRAVFIGYIRDALSGANPGLTNDPGLEKIVFLVVQLFKGHQPTPAV